MKKFSYDAKKFSIEGVYTMKKIYHKKNFFTKGLQIGNKDDNMDSMKAAFVKNARELQNEGLMLIVKKHEAPGGGSPYSLFRLGYNSSFEN